MPDDLQQITSDPDFIGLPGAEKHKVLMRVSPDYAGLPAGEQQRALGMLGKAQQPPAWSERWTGFKSAFPTSLLTPPPGVSMARYLVDPTVGPGARIIKGVAGTEREAWQHLKAGEYGKAGLAAVAGINPLEAPAENIGIPLLEKNYPRAEGAVAGTAAMAALPWAVPKIARVPGRVGAVASETLSGEGGPMIQGGAGQLVGGGVLTAMGHPWAGTLAAYHGGVDIIRGIVKSRAAIKAAGAGEIVGGAADTMLDDIAQSQAGKKFANLSPEQQATVRGLRDRISAGSAAPVPANRPATAAASPAPAPLPVSRQLPAPPRGPLVTPPPPDTSSITVSPAARGLPVRDPITGRMKRVYTSEAAAGTAGAHPVAASGVNAPAPAAAPLGSLPPPPSAAPQTSSASQGVSQGVAVQPIAHNMAAMGYDAGTQTLRVRFANGSEYDYAGVPPDVYNKLLRAPSKGVFLAKNIKGTYEYKKVAPQRSAAAAGGVGLPPPPK